MKVKKIPAREVHVGMTIVMGTKEDHQTHKVTEIHIDPKNDQGVISVGVGRIKIPYKLSKNPNIRITDEPTKSG